MVIYKLGRYPAFPLSLKLLYLASLCCYAIGLALYQWFCPSAIKKYEGDQRLLGGRKDSILTPDPIANSKSSWQIWGRTVSFTETP